MKISSLPFANFAFWHLYLKTKIKTGLLFKKKNIIVLGTGFLDYTSHGIGWLRALFWYEAENTGHLTGSRHQVHLGHLPTCLSNHTSSLILVTCLSGIQFIQLSHSPLHEPYSGLSNVQNHFCPKTLIPSLKWHGPFCPLKAFCLITLSLGTLYLILIHALEFQLCHMQWLWTSHLTSRK